MPVFGDSETVEKAVESILTQDYPEIEIILSVDGCKDSESVVKKIVAKHGKKKRGVQAIYSKKNRGACVARNEGAKLAKGKYLSFLPADGYLLPGVVRIWVEKLEVNPDYDFLYGGYRFLDEMITEADLKKEAKDAGEKLDVFVGKRGYEKQKNGKYIGVRGFDYLSEAFDPYFLETTNYIDGSFPLKTETFWKAGGWDPKIKSLQDWDLWLSVVKDQGGKGIFIRDIFFETEYPHRGGLSHDSTNHWLERTDTIKKKHGIERRKICVSSLGAGFHGRRTAKILNADFLEMPSFKPHRYEAVYLLGFFPGIADLSSQVFLNCKGKRIIHWIGSDIWQMQQMDLYHRKMLLDYFSKNIDVHLCEAEFTKKELKELGIEAQVVPLPPGEFFDETTLPQKFTVAVYQPLANKGFYLPDLCKQVADLCPDMSFKFFGDTTQVGRSGNIDYVGTVTQMQEFINDCSAILRLTIHDGLPISVLEFVCAGRQALLNVPVKFTMQTKAADPNIIAEGLRRLKKLGVNKAGAKYWKRKLSHKKFKDTLDSFTVYHPKEYWENRAESWAQLADQGYSLPQEDRDEIAKWLASLDYKSVLDIGCGNGRFVEMLDRGDYVGIDISSKLVKLAKQRFPDKKFKELKIENACNISRKFDLIFSYTALEHITEDNWPKAVAELKEIGKKILLIEPMDFDSIGHCHAHDYGKAFKILRKKKLSDKWLILAEL